MDKFRVVQLTQEALKVQCKSDDFEEWGVPLDLPQYQRKEQIQRETAFSKRGSIFWALVEKSDNEHSRDNVDLVPGQSVLCCHCESHRFDCAIRRNNGEIERGYSHHIGSVFTLPSFRKQGLATMFMKEVAKQLAALPGALASVLYSDIGPTYYDRLGWKLHSSKMATMDVDANTNDVGGDGLSSFVLDDGFDKFLETDNEKLVKELKSDKFQGREAFAVLPTRDSIEWQFCIGVYFATVWGFEGLPSRCGVKLNEDAFVVWCHNLKASTLYVVRARFPTETAATCILLNEALKEARKFKLSKVAIWDPSATLLHEDVARQFKIDCIDREDSLSSAMVFRDGKVDVEGSTAALPYWLGNEKYAWV